MEKIPDVSGLRQLPSVDELLQSRQAAEWIEHFGRPLTTQAIRSSLDEARKAFPSAQKIPAPQALIEQIEQNLLAWTTPSLAALINASGVILHTNLGRAPLSRSALEAVQAAAGGYSNLEFDLQSGKRGSRLIHAEDLLCRLTGAESALVVNNNAAAVLLVLSALAKRRSAVISRTQLVEIGGGFRVPDVMKQSGARLVEIGATNRVNLADYETAVMEENPALIMRVHRSNFRMIGFTAEPELKELAEVAHRSGIFLVDDIGSGVLLETEKFGLAHEPTIRESIRDGADLVCFSGDKLLGGPQAGIIVGKADLVARLRKHPLARAVRADKLCLAALSATLLHYLKDEAVSAVPIWRMIAADSEQLRTRACAWQAALRTGEVCPDLSTIGGGSLPEESLPTFVLALKVRNPQKFAEKLRRSALPVIARITDQQVLFDPRTVLPEQDDKLLATIQRLLNPAFPENLIT